MVARSASMQPAAVSGRPMAVQPAGRPGPILPNAARPGVVQPAVGNALAVPPGFHLRPSALGQRLPEAVQRKMEAFFGTSFADVRVHLGGEAASIGALAFTHGSDLYFAPGQYNPRTIQGQERLGHELAHVVQQRVGRVRNPMGSGVAVVQDPALEAEAERMGRRAAAMPSPVQAKMPPSPAAPARAPAVAAASGPAPARPATAVGGAILRKSPIAAGRVVAVDRPGTGPQPIRPGAGPVPMAGPKAPVSPATPGPRPPRTAPPPVVQRITEKQVKNVATLGLRKVYVGIKRALRDQGGNGAQPLQLDAGAQPLSVDEFVKAYEKSRFYHSVQWEGNIPSIGEKGLLNYADREKILGRQPGGMTAGEFRGDEKKGVFVGERRLYAASKDMQKNLVRAYLPSARTVKHQLDEEWKARRVPEDEMYYDPRFQGGALITKNSIPANVISTENMETLLDAAERGDEVAARKLGAIYDSITSQYDGGISPGMGEMIKLHRKAIKKRRLSNAALDNLTEAEVREARRGLDD
jgi:hypothetical protein